MAARDLKGALGSAPAARSFANRSTSRASMASRRGSDLVLLQPCHGVAFCTNDQFQSFAVVDPVLRLSNWLLVSRVWFAAEALVLNEPSRRQAGLSLLDAELDRRAGNVLQLRLRLGGIATA